MSSQERVWTVNAAGRAEAAISAVESAPVGFLVTDANGQVLIANDRFLGAVKPKKRAKKGPTTLGDFELALTLPREPCECALTADLALVWSKTRAGGWLGTVLEKRALTVTEASGIDPLTGLGNRQGLQKQFEASRALQGGYLLYLDLDRFKRVNDTLGHETGDALLQGVGRRLRNVLRDNDFVARIGGDEFVALIAEGIDDSGVDDIADRLIDKLSRPFLVNGMQVLIGASVGIACSKQIGYEEALRRADVALYESKHRGKGRATWYAPEMMAALEERRDLEHALRKALLLEEFVIHFQPQYSFDASSVTCLEALVRWQRPDGLLPPSEFIPVAEETGLMAKLGTFVLRTACQEASQWQQPVTVAVNVSPIQFMEDDFVSTVQSCLEISGLPPSRLELELTENVLLNDEDAVEKRMRHLRDLGVDVSLDDFGTGHASLRYLRKFPFSKIKIDQSFVREPLVDDVAQKIAGAVAKLGIELGVNVVAEGVETDEQLVRLKSQGVSTVQGFLLSEPIPASEIGDFLSANDERLALKKRA